MYRLFLVILLQVFCFSPALLAQEGLGKEVPKSLDAKIDHFFEPMTRMANDVVFFQVPLPVKDVAAAERDPTAEPKSVMIPFVVILLGGSALIFTLWLKFINVRSLRISLDTLRGKYSNVNDPGQITHFQALATALSGTVGLGNIAGVAIGISIGGPGTAFWMMVVGLLGMTTKFCECTLGVKYREIAKDGSVRGGPFYYFKNGFKSIGAAPVGYVFGFLMAIFCIGAAIGGGNMFQVNVVQGQLVHLTGGDTSFWADKGWLLGTIIALLTGAVIIGGIRSIARVTEKLVPFMCLFYVLTCAYLIVIHIEHLGESIVVIFQSAFEWKAGAGAMIGALIWGTRRAAFSNEAGFGSSPIAHSAVKTRRPASEGYVALLEPFVDTVIVCTMTAVVLVITGVYRADQASNTIQGIELTSRAFATGGAIFPYLLFIAVALFALSTLLSWCYYGQQAVGYLTGNNKVFEMVYKVVFCMFIVVGASMKMGNVLDFSDAMMFAMCFPNLIGLYLLMPKVKEEIVAYKVFREEIDASGTSAKGKLS